MSPHKKVSKWIELYRDKWWVWAIAVIVALIVIWLGVSWLRGWFPFTPPISEQQKILNSLTPPPGYKVIEVPQSVLDSMTPPPASSKSSKK